MIDFLNVQEIIGMKMMGVIYFQTLDVNLGMPKNMSNVPTIINVLKI